MIDIGQHPAVIFVFAMGECPACEHYLPRLAAETETLKAQGYAFEINPTGPPADGAIPIFIYDAASPDVDVQKLADRYGVSATPTTIVAMRSGGVMKFEGSMANNQIQWVLIMAGDAIR